MAESEVGIRLTLKERQSVARGLRQTSGDLGSVADSAADASKSGDQAAASLEKASSSKIARGFHAVEGGVKSLAGSIGRGLVKAAKAGAYGVAALGTAAGVLGLATLNSASMAQQSLGATETVFGKSSKKIIRLSEKAALKVGLSANEYRESANLIGSLFSNQGLKGNELATQTDAMIKRGSDLAAVFGGTTREAVEALASAYKGEFDPLEQYGISVKQSLISTEAMNVAGVNSKKAWDALTDAQQRAATQTATTALISKQSAKASGQFARETDTLAVQQQMFNAQLEDTKSRIGTHLLPVASRFFGWLNSTAIPVLDELAQRAMPHVVRAIDWFIAKGQEVRNGGLPVVLDGIRSSWEKLTPTLERFGSALTDADWGVVRASFFTGLGVVLKKFAIILEFVGNNADLIAKALPYLIAGFLLYKAAVAANNMLGRESLVGHALQIASNLMMVKSTKALTKALAERAAAQTAANAATTASLAPTAATTAATNTGVLATIRQKVALVASRVAQVAITVATRAWAAAQWLVNAAMNANPLAKVVMLAGLLAGGFVLLYKKSETFRNLINGLWNNILKPFGQFLGTVLLGYIKTVAKAWLSMGRFGVQAFRTLLSAAFTVFGGILSAADKGLGWIPGLGGKIRGAKEAFKDFGDATITKLEGVESALGDAATKVDNLGKKHATPKVTVTYDTIVRGSGPPSNKFANELPGGIAGARAAGGPVRAGQTYLVGEQGMELFRPKTDGTIVPNHNLGRVAAPNLRAGSSAPSIGMSEIADQLDSDASTISIGSAWPGGPTIVQLVVDGKVLTEMTLDNLEDRAARR